MLNCFAKPFVPQHLAPSKPRFVRGDVVHVYMHYGNTPSLVPWRATVQDSTVKRVIVLFDEAPGMSSGQTQDLLISRQRIVLAASEPDVEKRVLEWNAGVSACSLWPTDATESEKDADSLAQEAAAVHYLDDPDCAAWGKKKKRKPVVDYTTRDVVAWHPL